MLVTDQDAGEQLSYMYGTGIVEVVITDDTHLFLHGRRHAPTPVKRCRFSSFFYKAPELYNLLPEEMRQPEHIDEPDQSHVEESKKKLDVRVSYVRQGYSGKPSIDSFM